MKVLSLFILPMCFSVGLAAVEAKTHPLSPTTVMESHNIAIRVLPQYMNKIDLCSVKDGKLVDHDFAVTSTDNRLYEINPENTTYYRFIGDGVCGIQIFNATKYIDSKTWALTFFGFQNNSLKFTAKVEIVVYTKPFEMKAFDVVVGSSKLLDCDSGLNNPKGFTHCRILDNNGVKKSDLCKYNLDPVRFEDLGNWTCIGGTYGSIDEHVYVIHLKTKPPEELSGSVNDYKTNVSLLCEYAKSSRQFAWCRAVSPMGQKITLSEGIFNEKYSVTKSAVKDHKCSLEILKPVDPNDVGLWRIDMGNSEDDFTGCFLSVPGDSKAVDPKIDKTPENIVAMADSSIRFQCSVPWPAKYCYIRRPDGELIENNFAQSGENLLKAGVCVITADKVQLNQSGTWLCGLSSNDNTEDILFEKKVFISDKSLSSVEKKIVPVYGHNVNLLCISALRRPLRYCRFISPFGRGYTINPNINQSTSNSRLTYWGQGLEKGECGVKIQPLAIEDIGMWTCASTYDSFSKEEFDHIYVEKPVPTKAFTIGMSIGGVIVGVGLISLAVFGYRKKIQRNRNREHIETPSNSPPETPQMIRSNITTNPLYTINTPILRTNTAPNHHAIN